jgi:hypothetical protein
VFVHRYRDTAPEVRRDTLEAFRPCIAAHPAYFLRDEYTKYLGWMLNDADASVRVAALRALQPLYEDEALVPAMQFFTARFKPRMLDMCRDVDPTAAAAALSLARTLHQYVSLSLSLSSPCRRARGLTRSGRRAFLERKDVRGLLPLLWEDDAAVAAAAAPLVADTVRTDAAAAGSQKSKRSAGTCLSCLALPPMILMIARRR